MRISTSSHSSSVTGENLPNPAEILEDGGILHKEIVYHKSLGWQNEGSCQKAAQKF